MARGAKSPESETAMYEEWYARQSALYDETVFPTSPEGRCLWEHNRARRAESRVEALESDLAESVARIKTLETALVGVRSDLVYVLEHLPADSDARLRVLTDSLQTATQALARGPEGGDKEN